MTEGRKEAANIRQIKMAGEVLKQTVVHKINFSLRRMCYGSKLSHRYTINS